MIATLAALLLSLGLLSLVGLAVRSDRQTLAERQRAAATTSITGASQRWQLSAGTLIDALGLCYLVAGLVFLPYAIDAVATLDVDVMMVWLYCFLALPAGYGLMTRRRWGWYLSLVLSCYWLLLLTIYLVSDPKPGRFVLAAVPVANMALLTLRSVRRLPT